MGDKPIIDRVLAEMGETVPVADIYDVPDLTEAAAKAALVREGKADLLMKGKLDTAVLLKAVVNKEHGLGKGGRHGATSPSSRYPVITSCCAPWTAA